MGETIELAELGFKWLSLIYLIIKFIYLFYFNLFLIFFYFILF